MKKLSLLIVLFLFVARLSAQNCNYSYHFVSGTTTTVAFSPNSNWSPNHYNFVWDFGDGTTSTSVSPTHTFNQTPPYVVCYEILDSAGIRQCAACDTIGASNPMLCSFTATVSPASAFDYVFGANVPAGSTVTWDFGDGTTGTGIQTSHTFTANGNYNVCISVQNSNGLVICTYCHQVAVGNTTNNCYFTYAANSSGGFTFSAFTAYPHSTIAWDFGDGSTGSGTSASHSYANPGTYNVCMTETDSATGATCTSCHHVVVGNPSNCTFSASTSPANALTINFQANITNGSVISWDFGDGQTGTSTTNSTSHTYAAAGTYNVCMVAGSLGVTCTTCVSVTVGNNTANCVITYYAHPTITNTFTFNVQPSSSSSTIVWDFGDGGVDVGASVVHTYSHTGTYTVCMIERDSLQNIACTSCVVIHVGNAPSNCNASFMSSSLGLDAYFIDISVVNSTSVTYSWDFGDGASSSTQFPQHTYSHPGTYTVCLTIVSGSCTDTYCDVVTVDTTIFNPLFCRALFAIIQLAPYQVTVVNLSSGTNLSFLWDFGDGTTDTQAYPTHQYTTTGSYLLCLTVTEPNGGCTNTYCDTLSVDTLGNVFRAAPGFSINVVSPSELTGVKEISASKSFRVYPNPVTSDLYVTMLPGAEKATDYRILSMQGSEITKGNLNGINSVINTQLLSSGTYLLEVVLSDGSRSYQSVIKN